MSVEVTANVTIGVNVEFFRILATCSSLEHTNLREERESSLE